MSPKVISQACESAPRTSARPATAGIPKIGLFIESSRASGRALLHGIARYIHHHGPWSVYWEPGGLEKAWPKLKSLDLSGIILRDVENLEEVLALGIPAVVVGHSRTEISGLVNVVTDSETIGRMAAEHLLACGFRSFAYCGVENAPWSLGRRTAFVKRIEQAGWHCAVYPQHKSRTWNQEVSLLTHWLRSIKPPYGLMACNDDRAQQALEACRRADLAVPNAVGVIGVDNDEVICGLSNPPLSSIALGFERAGYDAAEILARMIAGEKEAPSRILVSATHLVARRSTEVVAVSDAHLAKALQFIRDQKTGAAPVTAVARSAGLSRRTLEKRFREVLGRSILEEIRRVRTDRIARLLVETDLPVARIADMLGFVDVQHIARYFRVSKQLSPAAYRKAHRGKAWCSQNGDLFAQNGVVNQGQKVFA